ncbi:hypothetical protein [Sulfitobacter sp. S190]|uniref:hypothetical protein n=1 Tax=Sulfitobacter sp. S190 TaxID=2867022 RepID=UPI0021A7E6E0|nr:hypothetical protein [Sulfitobacter sp. S190]UWR20941.1 hypothetical protein K3756_09385 [Sulfitobacter sp. S190]
MKTAGTIAAIALGAVVIAAGVYMIDIDQTQEARLPDVNIDVEEGQMPAFDAEVGEINLTQEEVTVETPDIDVTMEESTFTVPGIDIQPPQNDG